MAFRATEPDADASRPAPVDLTQVRPLLGIALVVCATFLFACNDTISKYLLETYDVPLVAAIRYMGHAILMLAILGPVRKRRLLDTTRPGFVALRSLCLVVATLFATLALQRMPIAETTSIIYIAPILVVLLARPLLGERIGLLGWLAALGGFAGVLLIVRPGGGLDTWGVIFALSNVGVTVAYFMLSRVLARSERTLVLLFHSALTGTVCFGLVAPWFWFDAVPGALDMILFASLGVVAGLGHFCFTAANRFAPASLLAPIGYSQLLWAGILGWLVFGQFPDGLALVGIVIIGCAGVAIALRSRNR